MRHINNIIIASDAKVLNYYQDEKVIVTDAVLYTGNWESKAYRSTFAVKILKFNHILSCE